MSIKPRINTFLKLLKRFVLLMVCVLGPLAFTQNAVIAALSSKSWDVETATELLLSN